MLLNLLLTISVFALFQPLTLTDLRISPEGFQISVDLLAIAAFVILLIVHELLHLIIIPGFASSKKTYAGITYMGGFVYSEEEIPKRRYLLITIVPFLAISLILPALLGIQGLLSPFLKILIMLNSMASSVDVLTFILVATQVPDGSYLASNGARTYWKKVSS